MDLQFNTEVSMLVLARQKNEVVTIGDDVEITVVDIRGDKVRLGISAPKEMAVHRKEIYARIKRDAAAAQTLKDAIKPVKP